MLKLLVKSACFLLCLLAGWQAQAQPIYYNNSSATTALNTLDSVATNGSGNAVLLTATGVDFNHINRCTAMAVDALSGKLFLVDGLANAIFVANINGSSPTLIKSGLTNYPTDLALDVLNQKIYYTTSSTITNNNTVQRMDYTGSNNTTLFTATGLAGNGVVRCTSIAVDLKNSKIFIADAGAQKIWSMSLTGAGLTALASTTNCYPSGLALDVTNQQVYFTASSPVQNLNFIQRVNYSGAGLITRYTASGSVQRCTALDLDLAHSIIYLSDAGANTLWKVPLAGGAATSVYTPTAAVAKKVRWYSGPTTRPPPSLVGIQRLSNTNIVLSATNGFVGGTYFILTSTNLTTPRNQWTSIYSNVLGASGSFSLTATNSFSKNTPTQFYILQVQ